MRPAAPAWLLALSLAFAGCSDSSDQPPDTSRSAEAPASTAPSPTAPPRTAPLRRSHCPPELSNCKTARGRIIYVERVDPDGDGDAHFVLTSRQSITLPGISVIDVEKSLRPHPLPVEGDRVSAAGPVYRGSFGQSQIQAIELHVARAVRPSR
jgi:hypothetical protein